MYYPKRPVKSFQDLEVYQKTYNLAIEIVRRVSADIARPSVETKDKFQETAAEISKKLVDIALEIPKLIASAHSLRFGDPQKAIDTLEKTMLSCNLAVVYLEQYRDLVNPVPADIDAEVAKTRNQPQVTVADVAKSARGGMSKDKRNSGTGAIEYEFFEEQIKEYLRVRGKIMRLQRAWKKFSFARP